MTLYRCFATGYKTKKGRQLVKWDDQYYTTVNETMSKDWDHDYYESIYLYGEEQYQQFKKTGSLAGITDIKTDRIVFDFDHKDPELAKADANELVSRLIQIDIPAEAIRIFYSGNKGFHVEIHINSFVTRAQFTNIIEHFAGDLQTFDTRIKDEQRLFRYPLSKHAETQNFKIPLTIPQLGNSMEAIINASRNDDLDSFFTLIDSWVPVDLPIQMIEVSSLDTKEKKKEHNDKLVHQEKPDLSRKPRHLTSAKYVLSEGFFEEGERNEACMILASTYRYLGYHKEMAYNMIKATLRLRAERLGLDGYDKDELWLTIIEPVYSDSWKGGTYNEEEAGLLKKTVQRYNLRDEYQEKSIVTVNEVADRFLHFAKNIDKNTIKTGIKEIDDNVLITSGMMVGLLGAPSSGKTTHALTFLEHQSMKKSGAFFVSADMPDTLAFGRLMQRYCGWDLKKILHTMKEFDYKEWDKKLQEAWDQVKVNFGNVGFSFQSGPTVQEIAERIDEHEQITGNKVRVLVVDYLEKVRCNMADATAASGYNAARLADLTRDKDLATILLLQPQKSAGDPSDDLLSMRKVKGASVIEQDCRVILTTWRPGFNPDNDGINLDDQYTSIAVVKNNMGGTMRMNFKWDGITGRIRSLTDDEIYDFERVCRETKERKANANAQGNPFEAVPISQIRQRRQFNGNAGGGTGGGDMF